MIETSTITKPEQYVQGWVLRYVEAVKGTRFPLGFHMLAGIWALSTLVGRRGRLKRPGFDLYPPVSVMLLGDSGVGKSSCMKLALRRILIPASQGRTGFFAPDGPEITARGLLKPWHEAQRKDNVNWIEGGYGFDEAKSLLSKRVGAESIMQFLISCLDHGSKYDSTGTWGELHIEGLTVSLAICSTLDPLRESVSVGEFVDGGFLHRFFTAHEIRRPQDIDETYEDDAALDALAEDARAIYEACPQELGITPQAEALLKSFREQSEDRPFDVSSLSGFWNRLSTMSAKLAMSFAISERKWTIEKHHVERAEKFIRGHLYPPLRALVLELSYDKGTRRIFKVSDDLYRAGPKGIPVKDVNSRLQAISPKQIQERQALMEQLNLAIFKGGTAFHPSHYVVGG